jgi:tripartite-type tricarboxylate transporter receptor subunit TctC
MGLKRKVFGAFAAIAALASGSARVMADPLSDFYKTRNVTISVGSAAGSGFTLYARLIARHMPKYIPGSPNMVVENLPGAGGCVSSIIL